MERTDPLADLLTAENLAGYYDGREPFSAENAESNKEAEVAERAVRDSLTRIRAVVVTAEQRMRFEISYQHADRRDRDSWERSLILAQQAAIAAITALTDDDRRLLGMDE